MNKYQTSKIYKIYSDLGDKIYIGCTTKQYLSQRMARHKYDYAYFKKCRKDNFAFVTSYLLFDEYGPDNCKIELLEAFPCNSIDEIRKREAHYIRTIPNINNFHNWTPERIEENKQKKKAQQRNAYVKNKKQISERNIQTKDQRKEYQQKYREAHKDEARVKGALRYQARKAKKIELVNEDAGDIII